MLGVAAWPHAPSGSPAAELPVPLLCPTAKQTITDLLDPSRTNLQVRENLEGQYVSNLSAHECSRGARAWVAACFGGGALQRAAALMAEAAGLGD